MNFRSKQLKEFFMLVWSGTNRSYGQIFFSQKKYFSFILLLVSFIDPYAGIAGFLSALIANMVALLFGYSKDNIKSGAYGFNALLVGLGLGVYFELSFALLFLLAISAIFSLLLSVSLEGFLYKYGLPFLTWPFLIVIWLLNVAYVDFTALGLSQRGLYVLNELYDQGGMSFVDMYYQWQALFEGKFWATYFLSLGAIFFQYNVIAGLVISIGLLAYSRIAFSLSIYGFLVAYLFYQMIGSDLSQAGYMYIGFNFILTAIALGGFFVIPSKTSYIWLLWLIPLTVIITISFSRIMAIFNLSVYALPFNLMVPLFLYALKLRGSYRSNLNMVGVQEYSPEKNLYSFVTYAKRFTKINSYIPIQLPFFGQWKVNQAHNGAYTHQGEWQHAWDFVVVEANGREFRGHGHSLSDYLCYNKPVLACADGVVEDIIDGIADNALGEVDLVHNWGNTIIIRHAPGLYSKLSHLKLNSFKVVKGEWVRSGQTIASCGNSGRSPYPHLHFQLQQQPFVGGKTLRYPLAQYYVNRDGVEDWCQFEYPILNEVVSRPIADSLLVEAFKWIIGTNFKWSAPNRSAELWEVKISPSNQTYLECQKTESKAYYQIIENRLTFLSFVGDKSTLLYQFYLSLQEVPLFFFEGMRATTPVRPNEIYSGAQLFFQDFLAPFYLILRPQFKWSVKSSDNGFSKTEIRFTSRIESRLGKVMHKSELLINTQGLSQFTYSTKLHTITYTLQ